MENLTQNEFYTLRDLARLGLWEHASFYGADLGNNLQVYRHRYDNALRVTCKVKHESWGLLLWDF